jgi:hypothetical protein
MSFRYFSVDLALIGHISDKLEIDGGQALALAQMYCFIHTTQRGRALTFSCQRYAVATGFNIKSVNNHLKKLVDLGWLKLTKTPNGKPNRVQAIELEIDLFDGMDLEVDLTSDLTSHLTSDLTSEGSGPDQSPNQSVVSIENMSNKRTDNCQVEFIRIWNETKPNKWAKLNRLSAPRVATLEKLAKGNGGLTQLVKDLPTVMRAVRSDSWWSTKEITFENFIGGKTAKGEFHKFLDKGMSMPGQTPDSPSNLSGDAPFGRCPFTGVAYHEHFYPERTSDGLLRARTGISGEARTAARAEAEAFYKSQQETN